MKGHLLPPIFKDFLASPCGSRGPFSYFLRENSAVLDDFVDPLLTNCYHRESRSLISGLESRLPHEGPIHKSDGVSVHVNVEEACRGALLESLIKSFSRCKDSRGDFQVLMTNDAGEVKHRSISKK